ncbi:hypothetical protein P175DRAFT_0155890 [Aspergillus ochraceoroseus IBT 24754]|uniref:Uncharacterized protein n=1 Tax=Aspergillus ochraceoroseus IBT 24754 TaxID=1392256 RepID=A0A2T5M3F3_9EURO|nr:uncharacterized protein P175DRAFT_0155890 [Aspergillus ochraceoroseus IBT 24754]PTU23052.1 hypothetical protein P175DRAFT_0155890 [Aspergillus ochraceoroseus IBT 24754]
MKAIQRRRRRRRRRRNAMALLTRMSQLMSAAVRGNNEAIKLLLDAAAPECDEGRYPRATLTINLLDNQLVLFFNDGPSSYCLKLIDKSIR